MANFFEKDISFFELETTSEIYSTKHGYRELGNELYPSITTIKGKKDTNIYKNMSEIRKAFL